MLEDLNFLKYLNSLIYNVNMNLKYISEKNYKKFSRKYGSKTPIRAHDILRNSISVEDNIISIKSDEI